MVSPETISAPQGKEQSTDTREKHPEFSSKFWELVSTSWLITTVLSNISHRKILFSELKSKTHGLKETMLKINPILEKSQIYGGLGCNNHCKANTFCFWQLRYENFEKEL